METLKNSIFEMPIIPQILNINILRTTSVKFIKLHTIRKLNEYSLKKSSIKTMFTPTVFKILMSKSRPVLSPTQRDTGNKIVRVSMKNQKNI